MKILKKETNGLLVFWFNTICTGLIHYAEVNSGFQVFRFIGLLVSIVFWFTGFNGFLVFWFISFSGLLVLLDFWFTVSTVYIFMG